MNDCKKCGVDRPAEMAGDICKDCASDQVAKVLQEAVDFGTCLEWLERAQSALRHFELVLPVDTTRKGGAK